MRRRSPAWWSSCRACRHWSRRGRWRGSEVAGPRGARRSLPPAGRRLRRELRRVRSVGHRAKLKILLQMSLVLVHGGRKRRGPGRAHGRSVRQAALGRQRDPRRRDLAGVPRRHGQSQRLHPRVAHAGSRAPAARLRARRADPQLHPRAGRGRLRRPPPPGVLGPVLRQGRLAGRRVPAHRQLAARLARVHGGGVGQSLQRGAAGRLLHSHEGLSLLYEQAQTRTVPRRSGWYNLSRHMPWIGMRTAQLERRARRVLPGHRATRSASRSVRRCRPSGSPSCARCWIPEDEPGRLVLIHRMGAGAIGEKLPPLIEAVQRTGRTVLWCSRPDARQHRDDQQRLQDAPVRQHPVRARAGVRHPRAHGHRSWVACTSR